MTTLATGLGKVENPTKASTKTMAALGLNAEELARKARTPGTGLIDVLKALEVQSKKTGVPLEKLVTATFGAGAVGLVSALAKQLPALTTLNTSLQSSSAKGLAESFGLTSEQLNFKITQIKTQLTNALTGIGITLLPTVTTLANIVTTTTAYLQKHPIAMTFLTDTLVSAIGVAFATKIAGLGLAVARAFGVASATAELANPIGVAIGLAIMTYMLANWATKGLAIDPKKITPKEQTLIKQGVLNVVPVKGTKKVIVYVNIP
jgi:hypothetical protein